MNKYELECTIAEMIEDIKEQNRFDRFIQDIPILYARRHTIESHLPLLWAVTNEEHMKNHGVKK